MATLLFTTPNNAPTYLARLTPQLRGMSTDYILIRLGVSKMVSIRRPPPRGNLPATGYITGIVPYTDAQTDNGKYTVTITASDGEDSVSASFTWYITDTDRLTQPDDQVSEPSTVVSLQLQATDNSGATLTYGATGLPAGLSINPTTGLISGTITQNPAKLRTHTVTVSVTGGGSTDTQKFTWTVLSSSQAYVDIAINDTESTNDDFTANLQPIQALVTLHDPVPGEHQVQIVVPSGLSAILGGNLILSDGQSAEITVVPQQYSQVENDVVLVPMLDGIAVAQAKETNAEITVTQQVTNPDTPAAMTAAKIFRIPPRAFTTIFVTVTPAIPGNLLIAQVSGQSNTYGRTKFASTGGRQENTVSWKTGVGGNLYITGQASYQTQPGFAGNLIVQILNAKRIVEAESLGFSVAAIPIGVKMSNPKPVVGFDANQGHPLTAYNIQYGTSYLQTFISDSGAKFTVDLNIVTVREVVHPPVDTGFFVNKPPPMTGGWLPATLQERDYNVTGATNIPRNTPQGALMPLKEARDQTVKFLRKGIDAAMGQGTRSSTQDFVFADMRTGVTQTNPAEIKYSGFLIFQQIAIHNGEYIIYTTRKPIPVGMAKPGYINKGDTRPQPTSIVVPGQ